MRLDHLVTHFPATYMNLPEKPIEKQSEEVEKEMVLMM